jgi:hypothetical protein
VSVGEEREGKKMDGCPLTGTQDCQEPVINVDGLEDVGDGTIPSPVMDFVASAFAMWNMANALVTESASI